MDWAKKTARWDEKHLSFGIWVFVLHSQYHGCSWPGHARSQSISNHNIDLVLLEYIALNICGPFLPEASFGLRVLSLPVSVCPCVRVSVCVYQSRAGPHDNSPLVQARITKFGTKVQKTLVKVPIVLGDDRPWLSRSNVTWKSNFTSFWACPPHNSSAVQARITKFRLKMHLSTVKIPINFGLDWFWSSPSFSILKPIFLPNLFALFLYYIKWDPSFVNISETIAGDRSNQIGLLTEHKFCRKLWRSISINSRYCNRFINLGRPIFPLNHSGASVATVFTILTTFGIAVLHSHWAGHQICVLLQTQLQYI